MTKKISAYFFLLLFPYVLLYSQSIDDLGIKITTNDRQFVFTNKEAGTFHGEVNGQNIGGWQGWFVQAEKIFHDYSLSYNKKTLDRTTATAIVYPHKLVRKYANGIIETVSFADSVNAIIIHVSNPSVQISLQPADFFQGDGSVWFRSTSAPQFAIRSIILQQNVNKKEIIFAISADTTIDLAQRIALYMVHNAKMVIEQRKQRMQRLLDLSPTKTNDRDLTMAIAWAKIQVDALIMNQSTGGVRTKGIFAGLPWFNNYWGRDSFISLPGATYVIGNFSDARDILRSYAAFQERDSTNPNFGRIPNLATPQSVIYNTADGTPWFVKSLYEYVKYSNDLDLIKEMYPVIARSIQGTIQYHTDSLGFLTHADAESWMDAVGPNGPWSPRGNRACDIQALWHQQLMVGVFCAEYFNDFHNASNWKSIADKLEKNFNTYFIDSTTSLIHDHLNADGSTSTELRPNQLFAFDMSISENVRQNMVRTVLRELVYEHGTATLAQSDSNFHPFHEYPPYYVKDAAYHNGIIWTWLNGASIYAATRYDLQDIIFLITKNSIHQMLHRGTVGALSELLDSHPRKKEYPSTRSTKKGGFDQHDFHESKLSGTYSQTWSLAEFNRSIYQDYFGVSVDVSSKIIRVQPKLPKEITDVEFEQQVGSGSITLSYSYSNKKDRVVITIVPNDLEEKFGINYLWVYKNGDAVIAPIDLLPDQTLTIKHTSSKLQIFHGKKKIVEEKNNPKIFLKNFSDKKYFPSTALATPDLHKNFHFLRGPSHSLLTHEQVKATNKHTALLFDQSDPTEDDSGISGTYQYPLSQHFKIGILDIMNAQFRYDDKNLYCSLRFANLYDPGWHAEYGFQLTLAAIAINTGNGNQKFIGQNSNVILDSSRAFDRLILVGGGVRILNSEGKILSEYIPKQEDVKNPIGNVSQKSVEFSIPLEYLGTPNPDWKISIFVGAQDDHGGAGIGEFRTITKTAEEWLGGGKDESNDSNVYDVLIIN